MAIWLCEKCDYARELRSDAYVSACKFCGAPEFDARQETEPNQPDELPAFIDETGSGIH